MSTTNIKKKIDKPSFAFLKETLKELKFRNSITNLIYADNHDKFGEHLNENFESFVRYLELILPLIEAIIESLEEDEEKTGN